MFLSARNACHRDEPRAKDDAWHTADVAQDVKTHLVRLTKATLYGVNRVRVEPSRALGHSPCDVVGCRLSNLHTIQPILHILKRGSACVAKSST